MCVSGGAEPGGMVAKAGELWRSLTGGSDEEDSSLAYRLSGIRSLRCDD